LERKNFTSYHQWMFDFLDRSSELQMTTLAVCFCHIWEARNETRNSTMKPSQSRTCGKIFAYIELIKENMFKTSPASRCDSRKPVPKWSPQPQGVILLNLDAALFEPKGPMEVGVVARDHRGTFLASCRQPIQGLLSWEEAEALDLQRSITLAKEEGYDKVVFASDCLSLVW
jgi:hypothetical protein